MKLTKKISAVVLAVLMIVVAVFAGCSSKGGNDKKADEPATSAAKVKVVDIELSSEEYAFGVDKKQPELKEKCNELLKEMKSSGELEEISNHFFGDGEPVAVTSAKQDNSKDQLVVATNAEFAPFEYKEGDKFYGIDMEIPVKTAVKAAALPKAAALTAAETWASQSPLQGAALFLRNPPENGNEDFQHCS